ncbi:nucleolar zinc-finger protein [Toensbergia leucococca]|nr:nucleolar zinc-finger protein [Toensbergia leucococca]
MEDSSHKESKSPENKELSDDGSRDDVFQSVGKQVEGLSVQDGKFADHDADQHDEEDYDDGGPRVVEEIESLCMNCEQNGTTRLLLTKIPYFREIILMSFYCDHCHFKNTEVQSAGEIQERGGKYVLRLTHLDDMERQVVKSDTAVFRVEELDIEVPAGHGKLTNVEGVLSEILKDLEYGQKQRKKNEPEMYEKIDAIVQPLIKMMLGCRYPFTITIDDPAGNSYIEPSPKDTDSKYLHTQYDRSPEENAALGLGNSEVNDTVGKNDAEAPKAHIVPQVQADEGDGMEGVDILENKMYSLPSNCPGCAHESLLNLQMVNIPYFKQVVISAMVCDKCGYKTNDVKTGGEVPAKGKRIWLEVKNSGDLRRDILKSETCMLKIPACKIEVVPGTMGGRFTTVEGLLTQVRDDLKGSIFDIEDTTGGDSMPAESTKAWREFFSVLEKAINGELSYTILLEDPLANSYVQSLCAPDPDPQIKTEEYERSAEDEEELGLADMKTHMGTDGIYVKETIEKGGAIDSPPVKDGEEDFSTAPKISAEDLPHRATTDRRGEEEDDFVVVDYGET